MSRMSESNEEDMILEKMKKRRQCKIENDQVIEEREDRLSDLPDGVILHILSFFNTKHVVRTCVLSKKREHLWKHIQTLVLHSSRFSIVEKFAIFVSKILTLRHTSTALHKLDLDRHSDIEPQLLTKILNYFYSHNTHLKELGITVNGDTNLIMRCVSSCWALTSLKLDVTSRGGHNIGETLFPKSLNLPALTSLDLICIAFCGGESGCAEPFSAFKRLNNLVISCCTLKDAQILKISSETLANLAMHHNFSNFAQIELSAPSLCTFTITGMLTHKICGNGLSSVKQVNIATQMYLNSEKPPMVLLSWLLDLANVKSMTAFSTTL